MRGFLFATASAWSYRPLVAAWEPVLEPWQVLVHLDQNARAHYSSGIAPGTWIRVTSTQGCVTAALSHAAAQVRPRKDLPRSCLILSLRVAFLPCWGAQGRGRPACDLAHN